MICQKISHLKRKHISQVFLGLLMPLILLASLSNPLKLYAKEAKKKKSLSKLTLRSLREPNHWNYINFDLEGREIASFIPDDSLFLGPEKASNWADKLFAEDDRGVLQSMKTRVNEWEEKEEYARDWKLESTGVVPVTSSEDKQKFLIKKGLKYLDKRVSGEISKARPGEQWSQVGKVRQALRPKTKFEISKQVKVKFKAQVLQGKLQMNLENPYIDAHMEGKINGKANAYVGKSFKDIGLDASTEYRLKESEWISSIKKEIYGGVSAQAISIQRGKTDESRPALDKTIQFLYSSSF